MKALREVYDFITGGSLVSPIGLGLAVIVTLADAALPPMVRVLLFAGTITATLAAASFERAR